MLLISLPIYRLMRGVSQETLLPSPALAGSGSRYIIRLFQITPKCFQYKDKSQSYLVL